LLKEKGVGLQKFTPSVGDGLVIVEVGGFMLKGSHHFEETRAKLSASSCGNTSHLGHKQSLEAIEKMRKSKLGKRASLETRGKMSEAQTGERHHRYGKVQSEDFRHNVSNGLKRLYQTPEGKMIRKQIDTCNRGNHYHLGHKHSPEAIAKMSAVKTGKVFSEETRKKMSKTGKEKWEQEEHRNKLVRASRQALKISPNKPELELLGLLNEASRNDWKYVGDGQIVVCGRNPDYININGKKAVVLLHGVYWHLWQKQKENPKLTKEIVEQEDINFYRTYGWDALIVWDDELKSPDKVKDKIKEFVGS